MRIAGLKRGETRRASPQSSIRNPKTATRNPTTNGSPWQLPTPDTHPTHGRALAQKSRDCAYYPRTERVRAMTFFNTFRHKSTQIACALVALLLLSAAARAQDPDEDVVPINSNLVILNVGVADQKGHAITNLTQSDR